VVSIVYLSFLQTDFVVGALSAKSLQRVILDASYIDEKKRSLFTIKEVADELHKLLDSPQLREGNAEGDSIEFIFY
jgi:protein CMS1